jgi:hypothetical protein
MVVVMMTTMMMMMMVVVAMTLMITILPGMLQASYLAMSPSLNLRIL